MDLLDRLLIIRTLPYNREEMESILKKNVTIINKLKRYQT